MNSCSEARCCYLFGVRVQRLSDTVMVLLSYLRYDARNFLSWMVLLLAPLFS